MIQSVIINRYGINKFLSKIYLNRIDNISNNGDYEHTFEIIQGDGFNGNGYCTMKIYTKGELKELSCGTWRISPIIKMPYCWTGYSDRIDVVDRNGESYMIQITPDQTSLFKKGKDFTLDVKAVYEKIFSLDQWYNVSHLQLEEIMTEIEKDVERCTSYPVQIGEKIEMAKNIAFKHDIDSQFQQIRDLYIQRIVDVEKKLHDKFPSNNNY